MQCTPTDACWRQQESISCSIRRGTESVSLVSQERSSPVDKNIFLLDSLYLRGSFRSDWPSNCQHLPADCTILDPVPVARRISNTLRATHGVDIVIALTHMRREEDLYLAQQCDANIDVILGGHDHDLAVHGANMNAIGDAYVGHIKLVKSGTDFKSFSDIRMHLTQTHGKAAVGYITGRAPELRVRAPIGGGLK